MRASLPLLQAVPRSTCRAASSLPWDSERAEHAADTNGQQLDLNDAVGASEGSLPPWTTKSRSSRRRPRTAGAAARAAR